MTPQEKNLAERGRLLLHAAEHETDTDLALALTEQGRRVYMKAIQKQMDRKQSLLKARGLSLRV